MDVQRGFLREEGDQPGRAVGLAPFWSHARVPWSVQCSSPGSSHGERTAGVVYTSSLRAWAETLM